MTGGLTQRFIPGTPSSYESLQRRLYSYIALSASNRSITTDKYLPKGNEAVPSSCSPDLVL